jgi:thiamine-phosphate pyrophosphorylase
LSSKILPGMSSAKTQVIEGLFEALGRGDLEGAFARTTEDIVLDRTNSQAPWRGVAKGRDQVRADYAEFRDPIEGLDWVVTDQRQIGLELVAVSTRISMRGRSSGIDALARGGWLVRFEGDLVAEATLYQSYAEAQVAGRRQLLDAARLYFVCEGLPNGSEPTELLEAAIAGGVDMIQLREKAPRCAEELVAMAQPFAKVARERGALFFLNDHPELVEACEADGVHVGQDDEPVASARATAGAGALVGLSTHSPEQFDAALAAEGAARPDQVSAGPVWETPTKEGRPAAGLQLIEHAGRVTGERDAWFAIGGIDVSNVSEVVAAGARRIVVVRAIRDATDPEVAARELASALDGQS